MRRLDCHDSIKQVRDDYQTVSRAVRVLVALAEQNPELLYDNELGLAELRQSQIELRNVYFVRMFARFESSLRHYWRTAVKKTSKPKTEDLVKSIAGRHGVPADTHDAVHEIRKYRNYLIHEESDQPKEFTIDEGSSHLNTYLARLPREW